jgi:hypothetical protein
MKQITSTMHQNILLKYAKIFQNSSNHIWIKPFNSVSFAVADVRKSMKG